jgi:ribosome biogenesis GTPase
MMANELKEQIGTIIKGVGGYYEIFCVDRQIVQASPRGILRRGKLVPTVGDHVRITVSGDPDIPYVIEEILPRKNLMLRPAIANIDLLLITVSSAQPSPDFKLLDKLLIHCAIQNIEPLIMTTKKDLDEKTADLICHVYGNAGFQVFSSAINGISEDARIREHFHGKTVALAGQSGVGKSTLCNLLSGYTGMAVGEISDRLKRGKHTTRHVELIPLRDIFLMDTPGFSSLEITRMQIGPHDVQKGYPEIIRNHDMCRFQDCYHLGELGCAVESFDIDAGRLERYRGFVDELKKFKPFDNKRGDRKA